MLKPPKKIVVEADQEAIATRTRSRQVQDVPGQHVGHPHDLNIDAVCCDQSKQECAKSPGGFHKNLKLCYRSALSPPKIIDTPTMAMQHVKSYVKEVYEQSLR
jgi:hypothetical protein